MIAVLSAFVAGNAHAQYFGQNKVRYKNLKFKVYKTPHFEIYYYMKNDSLLKRFAQESELWYTLHQQVFRDTFRRANPIILYANHPDFQQTTAIDGEISVGTGGVTEGLKNRVVMPIMETNQTTRHVIGHELVHAFQYHSLLTSDTTSLASLNNLPLWMIEGMAEYLSLGKKDAYTAMWMRDAYLNHDIPTLRDLTESTKYFPYRYGEAFWSFLGSTYGDTIIVPFFKNTARFGLQYGIRRTFGYDDKTLSKLWKNSIETTYQPYLKDTLQTPVGKRIIDNKNAGDMNVAPSISPDGKYLAFLSEKDLFTVDLYLADAKSGRVIKKLTSKVSNTHIDEFNFIESAGTWSPDGKKFAFSVFNNGRNRMLIVSIPNGRVLEDISMGKVEQFSNLSWSPDGKNIAFQGMTEGQGDIYTYNFDTKKVTQLTNDKYSDYQPTYSRDGRKIIFSTDRTTYDKSLSQEITFNLAEIDVATGLVNNLNIFNGANNLNPQYSADGSQIYFLSNKDGFRNMYRYTLASGKTEQMTDLFTGISGITEYSPALSVSAYDDIVYSYYRRQKYALYNAKASEFKATTVEAGQTNFDAAMLPPPRFVGVDQINANLQNYLAYPRIPVDSIKNVPYRPQFKLDYLASSGVGVGVSTYGAGLASGIQGVFSDILGRNQIFAGASVNGEVYDFGAQVAYINQQGRWNVGGALSHIPFQFANYNRVSTTYNNGGKPIPAYEDRFDIIRIFQDQANLFTAYPFSKVTRLEFGGGISHYYYRVDRYSTYYDTTSLAPIAFEKHHVANSDYQADPLNSNIRLTPFTILQVNTALVGDNSFFGVTAPLNGFRYRIQAEYDFGSANYFAPSIDLRKYERVAPVTFAGRFYTYGRFGQVGNLLYPLFVGYPFLIRGYEYNSFYNSRQTSGNGFTVDQLSGNRIAVANFEVRLPFTGPEKLAQIKSKFLFTDLNLFFDAGLAWNQGNEIKFALAPDAIGTAPVLDAGGKQVLGASGKPVMQTLYNTNQRVPALSAGVSLRVNLFGYLVLEPYLAIPFNRTDIAKPVFGLGFTPGW
ncbi:DPP IV N-terminal domain-containing protein [Mucilaginibacter ginkgonis]|uniref:PD40 domain-containing protein n=1 Tax=Mucilaginibacter ginkgonis TaxID=2682091 RepID=A0A6I4HWC7_9SPHI|nr:DPP IV N-terminal domain-containing protein [Mucilaginibacter ginkgonis]QQL51525.1 PD40 domain-containing protein [Mucilaginibacter ginkgonis]